MTRCLRKPWRRLLVATFCMIVLAMFAVGGCGQKEPWAEPYSCPEPGYISCMPPVTEEGSELCGGECHDWIVENCPDLEFVW